LDQFWSGSVHTVADGCWLLVAGVDTNANAGDLDNLRLLGLLAAQFCVAFVRVHVRVLIIHLNYSYIVQVNSFH